MSLRVKIRKDTGTLWITGTITPSGLAKGYRIRKRAASNDRAVAEMEAQDMERTILCAHRAYPAMMQRERCAVPDSWGKKPPRPLDAIKPFRRRRGFWSPTSWGAGLNWSAAPDVWIYVMEGGDKIKVGLATNVGKRLADLNRASPVPVVLFSCSPIRADVADWCEYLAHTALADWHSHSEWFNCSAEQALVAATSAVKRAEKIPEMWVYAGNNPSRWQYPDAA